MSEQASEQSLIEIEPKKNDIGSFEVRRFLPSAQKRAVGPFIFFDEMGPAVLKEPNGMDVRPHPHIGLSTLTWMIEGEIVHRDSLGYIQTIKAGEVNWMTAGRGIVHSERTAADNRTGDRPLHGLQIWMALPSDKQEIEPSFQHVKNVDLPKTVYGGVQVTVIAGQAFGLTSPVQVHSPTIYLDLKSDGPCSLDLPNEYEEQAVFIVKGSLRLQGQDFKTGDFVVLPSQGTTSLESSEGVHLVLLGGQALRTRRYLWWNFASTSKDRIEQAKADWQEGRFPKVVEEADDSFIPLPD